jgi:pseudouridine synthase
MIRLNKFLAQAGLCSRRTADVWIREGRVRVNGEVVQTLGAKIDPEKDRVEVDGKPVKLAERERVILFNKPKDCLTTVSDPFHRRTVLDYVSVPFRIYPVGRLDFDTEGLLLLTNSGELAFRLTHPRYEIEKVYEVKLRAPISDEMVQQLTSGVKLEGGPVVRAKVEVVSPYRIHMVIHQGLKRQVKRMIQAVGNRVVGLKRIRFAGLELGGLSPGEWRYLTDEEIVELKKSVRLPWK